MDELKHPHKITLQQAKDEIAKDYGKNFWWEIDFARFDQEVARDKVAELYASSRLKEAEEKITQLLKMIKIK